MVFVRVVEYSVDVYVSMYIRVQVLAFGVVALISYYFKMMKNLMEILLVIKPTCLHCHSCTSNTLHPGYATLIVYLQMTAKPFLSFKSYILIHGEDDDDDDDSLLLTLWKSFQATLQPPKAMVRPVKTIKGPYSVP